MVSASSKLLTDFALQLKRRPQEKIFGRVQKLLGLLVEVVGLSSRVQLGSIVRMCKEGKRDVLGEVVGFRDDVALVMGYGFLEGLGPGARVELLHVSNDIYPTMSWQGRIIDGLGRPLDGCGPLPQGNTPYALKAVSPDAHKRQRVEDTVNVGVRAINTFITCCKGQRMGIFSAAGVGKSSLLGQMARYTSCDVIVVGLIGERGREVNEFIEDHLGSEGLKKAVVVVATSDQPALVRRQAAYMMMAVAQFFMAQDLNVLCVMDSVTRFAHAQREIGLSAGEPPTTRGYPPSVFSELSRLLERAGQGEGKGSITGFFSVLVEGDDHDEPIADAVRSFLDGHVVLDRDIAQRGRYPAINVLKSLSRTRPRRSQEDQQSLKDARSMMSLYDDMQDMVRLGAYKAGQSTEIDAAIKMHPLFENFLSQSAEEAAHVAKDMQMLKKIMS